jgi:hypothetical protein
MCLFFPFSHAGGPQPGGQGLPAMNLNDPMFQSMLNNPQLMNSVMSSMGGMGGMGGASGQGLGLSGLGGGLGGGANRMLLILLFCSYCFSQ